MTHIDGYGTDRIGCTTSNMPNAYDIIRALSDVHQASSEPDGLIEDFASAFGWRPSDLITTNGSSGERPSLHVLVEQGLLNTAAISFFPESLSSSFLQRDQRRDLIGISYNNIVDWHVWVETDRVRYIFNRTDPPSEIASLHFSRSDYSALDYERFERAVADAPNADVPALDDALLETVSRWRRLLVSEVSQPISNYQLSTLFNAILLVRAAEDLSTIARRTGKRTLVDAAYVGDRSTLDLFNWAMQQVADQDMPPGLLALDELAIFDPLPKTTWVALLGEFYQRSGVPYRYDFSVMSKHAISRIYEKYVADLKF